MKSEKISVVFLQLVYLAVLAVVSACYIALTTLGVVSQEVGLKSAASAIFVLGGALNLYYALRYAHKNVASILLFVAALLCFAGDVAICYNFIAGLALFLLGHVAYLAGFSCVNCVGWRTVLPAAAAIAVSLCVLLLVPSLDFGEYLPAVIIYAIIISCMFGRACGIAFDGTQRLSLRLCAFFGALAFVISDLMLAFIRFADGGTVLTVLCLAFYYIAQYLLTLCIYGVANARRQRAQMNVFKRLYCRAYQAVFRLIIPFLPYRQPEPLDGPEQAALTLKKKGCKRALIVTDKNIYAMGLCTPLEAAFAAENIDALVYSDTVVNPTVANCEAAAKLYREHGCDCLVAVGGGSAMDCAKGAGALIIKPKKTLAQMRGVLKVFGKFPPFIAVPTTAGTGSEATIAAVITDDKTRDKFTIISFCLAPHYAILDPAMTVGLPPHITSTTGMDALTHAVEAYIGRSSTRLTRRLAVEAVSIIRANIYEAYSNGSNRHARRRMQYAAYCAGLAFTISYVGYVHAVAHSLGGKYNTPHGLANAVILPYALKRYGVDCRKRLARLARKSGVADVTLNDEDAANTFIEFVETLNKKMGIPTKLKVAEGDIPELARHADKEGNPLYPVPALMNAKALESLYHDIKEQ